MHGGVLVLGLEVNQCGNCCVDKLGYVNLFIFGIHKSFVIIVDAIQEIVFLSYTLPLRSVSMLVSKNSFGALSGILWSTCCSTLLV